MTSFAQESKEQEKWLPQQNNNIVNLFNKFVENEFTTPKQQLAYQQRILDKVLRFSLSHVPYYQDLIKPIGMKIDELTKIENLTRFPILNKSTIQEQYDNFRPDHLPPGERDNGWSESSGSSGKPFRVYRTQRSRVFELMTLQRQFRWFRYDPHATMAWIRDSEALQVAPDNRPLNEGETLQGSSWPGLGTFFVTGPYIAFSITNSPESKIAWLERHNPAYIRAFASELEHLAFAFQGRKPLPGLQSFRSVGEPLTEGMRNRIESAFGIPVYTSYGLNELGWIATKCVEGGRYHIHSERCIVEIVREDGTHCDPGEYGQLLITLLDNLTMPLIRYNSGDIAQATAGQCPCGRTLPTMGEIVGRAAAITAMPAQILLQVEKLRHAMDLLPDNLAADVRGYQIHHHQSGDLELKVLAAAALSGEFKEYFYRIWQAMQVANSEGDVVKGSILIKEVGQLPRVAASGKFHYLTSDLMINPAIAH